MVTAIFEENARVDFGLEDESHDGGARSGGCNVNVLKKSVSVIAATAFCDAELAVDTQGVNTGRNLVEFESLRAAGRGVANIPVRRRKQ